MLADNVNLETLSQYCHATVDELKDIQEKIEDLRNKPDFSIDDIAEEIQVPVAVAKRMYSKLNPNAEGDKNVPRVVRKDGKLVYFLPKEANFSSKDCEEIRYRFKFSGSSVPVWIIYKKKGNC